MEKDGNVKLVEKPVFIAGCYDCHGMTPRWRGKKAYDIADAHGEETGHRVWKQQGVKLTKVQPPPKKKQPNPMAIPSMPEARLSRKAMCGVKKKHHSAACAQKQIDATDYHNKELLNVYQCFYCGKWHVGHIIKPWAEPSA